MKKITLFVVLTICFTNNAQAQFILTKESDKKPKKQVVAVMNEFSSSSTKFTITRNTSTYDLNNIVKLAKNYGVELSFTNEKYHGNQLEYIELNYFSNNKWETLTF